MRVGAREAELTRARAAAEARAAEARGDDVQAERQRGLARSSQTLRAWYENHAAELEQADADYREWSHATEGARQLAVAADAELRRREPGIVLEPLRSAEPAPVTEAEHAELERGRERGGDLETAGWVRELAQARPAFREELAGRQSLRVPEPDPQFGDQGPAWPAIGPRERDAIRRAGTGHAAGAGARRTRSRGRA